MNVGIFKGVARVLRNLSSVLDAISGVLAVKFRVLFRVQIGKFQKPENWEKDFDDFTNASATFSQGVGEVLDEI